MEFIYLDSLNDLYEKEIQKILYDADDEFVPALSARASTTQTLLSEDTINDNHGAYEYFQTMKKQSIILAVEEEGAMAFLSFIPGYHLTVQDEELIKTSYVSTIVVSPEYRGRGICPLLYDKLFSLSKDNSVSTRTWSTNISHISILRKLGFKTIATLPDDRGKGVDTVYFCKEL